MRRPRVRLTVRALTIVVAVAALLTGGFVLARTKLCRVDTRLTPTRLRRREFTQAALVIGMIRFRKPSGARSTSGLFESTQSTITRVWLRSSRNGSIRYLGHRAMLTGCPSCATAISARHVAPSSPWPMSRREPVLK
jgi:hypothetical protein